MPKKLKIEGEARLLKKLAALGSKTAAKRVLRRAASAAATPLKEAVKSRAPTETEALKKAIGKEVRSKGFNVDARVGARADYEHAGRRPAKYDHLVEFGTEDAPAQPFLRPGYDATEDQMRRVYREKVAEGLAAEQRKLKGKK